VIRTIFTLMDKHTEHITSWGRFLSRRAQVWRPKTEYELIEVIKSGVDITPRGNAKSYGDAALGNSVISTLALNQIIDFDEKNGIITCQSGVMLSDLIALIVPKSWFFHVTPGIKTITVGGAIAADVHGKNHKSKGCFSRWLLGLSLVQKDGTVVHCSRVQHADLFYQTCGGMGLTGVVLTATFQLMPIKTAFMQQTTQCCTGLQSMLTTVEQSSAPYCAVWVDLHHCDAETLKTIVYTARHADEGGDLNYRKKIGLSVPFVPPFNVLSSSLMRIYHALIWQKAKRNHALTETIPMDQYFYPLDSLGHWNRLYGPQGFVQYQFCVPAENSVRCLEQVIDFVRLMKEKPRLSVIKIHGSKDADAINSFPMQGFSLAMDWPATPAIITALRQLDDLIWPHGAQIYLAKDAISHGRMSRFIPPILNTGFSSDQSNRLKKDTTSC
jgi:decaprenylphospho-beta-D-ribofuranose 2-oxidase